VPLPAEAGELEIIVGDLPAQIIGSSLYADAAEGVTIRSVRYRSRAVGEATKKEIAELDKQIKEIGKQQHANNQMRRLLDEKRRYLDKLERFTAPTINVEMTKGVLDAKTLAELTDYLFAQRAQLTETGVKLHEERNELNEQRNLLHRKRSELTRGADSTIREAVIFVSRTAGATRTIRLSYLVGSANWSPTYNIRLSDNGETTEVEYLAHVHQMSGEEWTDVNLTLSTATPNMNAENPPLVPLWLGLIQPRPAARPESGEPDTSPVTSTDGRLVDRLGGLAGSKAYKKNLSELRRRQRTALVQPQQTARQVSDAFWAMNEFATEIQNLELNVRGDVIRKADRAPRTAQEGLAVSYSLPGPMSLASRPDKQLVQIAKLNLPGEIYYQAVPLLTTYVYRIGEITNDSTLPLLAGPYSAYIGGQFVGRGSLRLLARGQKATIGFGVDTQLRCSRELMDKSDEISWGSRIQLFHYRLRLENFKDDAVTVRLLDRIPATKSDDIKITLGKMSDPLSSDPVYLRDWKDRGILRWDIELGAQAAGAKAKDVTYNFEMKFAKDKHVGRHAAGLMQKMRAEYDEMMRLR
ncbi:MAG: DUF4139 domain-containing protein, partial [Phycisphaerae bacterium]|nr:DUF4139 domain-containing protein [Phycisphaerae bacterium]